MQALLFAPLLLHRQIDRIFLTFSFRGLVLDRLPAALFGLPLLLRLFSSLDA